MSVPLLLLRVHEAAEALGISRAKAYQLIAARELPSVKVGASVRVPVQELQRWIDRQLAGAESR